MNNLLEILLMQLTGLTIYFHYSKEYTLVSLNVVSFFTNVPLHKFGNIILKPVYNKKLINMSSSKVH